MLRLFQRQWQLHLCIDESVLLTTFPVLRRVLPLAAATGIAIGVLGHNATDGSWLVALLILSALVVGIAQQTLP